MVKVQIDVAKLNKAIALSFDKTVDRLSDALDEAMEQKLYDWPRLTRRRNGEIAGAPRNIIDTEELINSKAIARSSSSLAAEFSWDAPYAAAVRNGCTLRNGTEIPARKWDEKALEISNPRDVFQRELRRQL